MQSDIYGEGINFIGELTTRRRRLPRLLLLLMRMVVYLEIYCINWIPTYVHTSQQDIYPRYLSASCCCCSSTSCLLRRNNLIRIWETFSQDNFLLMEFFQDIFKIAWGSWLHPKARHRDTRCWGIRDLLEYRTVATAERGKMLNQKGIGGRGGNKKCFVT